MSAGDLPSLKGIFEADVYKAGRLAARLHRRDGLIEFRYADGYAGPAVATTLPVRADPVVVPGGAVPPFFAGLLPEGRRLSQLRRAVKTSADDELSLLLAVGRDTIGDVQVVPVGAELTPATPLVSIDGDWSTVRFGEVLADAGMIDVVGLPGIQDKASARMISVPVSQQGERYLLKLDPPEFPHVVVNEAYFAALARRARLPTVHAQVVRDGDDRPGLLVRRFDRVPTPDGTAQALPCEDACQVLGRWPADKYAVSAEAVVNALADRCAARLVARRRLFEQLCFGWLTGNGDIHAKNLSILGSPRGEWTVAPAYDLPSTLPYGDTTFALAVGGRTSGLSRRRWLEFAGDIGLPVTAAEAVIDKLLDHLGGIDDALASGALPFAPSVTRALVKELRYRRRQMVDTAA